MPYFSPCRLQLFLVDVADGHQLQVGGCAECRSMDAVPNGTQAHRANSVLSFFSTILQLLYDSRNSLQFQDHGSEGGTFRERGLSLPYRNRRPAGPLPLWRTAYKQGGASVLMAVTRRSPSLRRSMRNTSPGTEPHRALLQRPAGLPQRHQLLIVAPQVGSQWDSSQSKALRQSGSFSPVMPVSVP